MGTTDPYDRINFIERRALINDKDGNVIFDKQVTFPDHFDQNSVNIVASKYFKEDDTDIRQLIDRVSGTINSWAIKDGYIDKDDGTFLHDLKYFQMHQYFAFNSPVYFNVGSVEKPQSSACFILSVGDSMDSITDLAKNESIIFKNGSGAGSNLSKIRGSRESVAGTGTASGPVSFLKAHDCQASIIKSGGALRRSAKLSCLDINHPDIEKFITCKEKEELKMKILMEAGIEPDEGYEMSDEVFLQNTNLSIRITDGFINAVKRNESWETINRTDGTVAGEYKARDLLMLIAKQAWRTGDPGVQFHDIINRMNPVPSQGIIDASNPCSEYMFLDDTSCNLASLNWLMFFDAEGNFDYDTFVRVVRVMVMAMDVIVDNSSYPIESVEKNTRKYRALGLGYTNLGALLMCLGLPYDSEEGRKLAALLTSLMTGVGYTVSQHLAGDVGQPKWWNNTTKKSMYKVIANHHDSLIDVYTDKFQTIREHALDVWESLYTSDAPFRNVQISVLAPTGTISFMMGADTTGIEPDFSLVKFKRLSGQDGATIKTVNNSVKRSMQYMGYDNDDISIFAAELTSGVPPEKSKVLRSKDLAVFDTAMNPENGERFISYEGHLKMMAAVQPFISGAISKTINLPNNVSVDDIFNLYLWAWDLGLKSVAVYRDGSKNAQVLSTKEVQDVTTSKKKVLPTDRQGTTHKFTIGGNTKGYITANDFDDGNLGEIFVNVARQGTTLSGLIDSFFTLTSISLQHGVHLKDIAKRMVYTKFEPSGFTRNENIRTTSSLLDYIFRHLSLKYLTDDELIDLGLKQPTKEVVEKVKNSSVSDEVCPSCGSQMRLLGSCHFCDSCAFSSGSCG